VNCNSFGRPKYWPNVSNALLFVCFQYVTLTALLAVANAWHPAAHSLGYAAASVAVDAPSTIIQSSNILKSYGNLGQVSTYSKTIDTPYSSVRKSDVGVSNDALVYSAAPVLLSSPGPALVSTTLAAPIGHSLLGVAHSAAPAVARLNFTNGLGLTYTY
jgi:hypothetical protein